MLGRILEDGFFLARFAFHYYQAPKMVHKVGFYDGTRPVPKRERLAYAYRRSAGLPGRGM